MIQRVIFEVDLLMYIIFLTNLQHTVIFETDLFYNGIHGPAIQLLIGHDLQGQVILLLVPLHCL